MVAATSIPDPIQHLSERVLEFDHLRELLLIYAASPLGKGRIASIVLSRDRHWIERQQRLSEELGGYLRNGGRFDFSGLLDPTELIHKSRIKGAALELTEVRDLLFLADRAAEWREISSHPPVAIDNSWDTVGELSLAIADFTPLLRY